MVLITLILKGHAGIDDRGESVEENSRRHSHALPASHLRMSKRRADTEVDNEPSPKRHKGVKSIVFLDKGASSPMLKWDPTPADGDVLNGQVFTGFQLAR